MKRISRTILGTLAILCLPLTATAQESAEDWLRQAAEPYSGTTIYLANHPNTYSRGLEQYIPRFEELTGIDVQMDLFGEPVAVERISAELAGGTGAYDAVWAASVDYRSYIEAGWISPLDEFMANDEITGPDLLERDDFVQSLLEAGEVDGSTYALPTFAATTILYYRTDVFEELDIDGPPETIDELLSIGQRIADSDLDIAPIALRGARGQAINMWVWPTFLRGMGGTFFEDYPDDLAPALHYPEVAEAAEIYRTLLSPEYSIPGANVANYDEVVRAFQEGRAAMMIDGAPLAGRILDPEVSQVVGDTGFAVVPGGPAGRFPAFNAHGWMIPSQSQNKEAAWLFLQWATWSDLQQEMAVDQNYAAPTKNTVWESPEFIERYSFTEDGAFLRSYQESLNIALPHYRPPLPEWPEIGDTIGLHLNEVTSGSASAEEAMEEANQAVREIMERAGYLE